MFMYNSFTNLDIWKQVSWLVDHWLKMEEKLSRLKPGEILYINASGIIVPYEEFTAKSKQRKRR